MREAVSGEGQLGMRVGGQQQGSQQTLPPVSHVMGPLPSNYRSSSYVSPQSSQPTTPLHSNMNSSPLTSSPTSGPSRMVNAGQQNRSPLSMSANAPVTGSAAFTRPPDPAPLVQNPQMHVISSTQYSGDSEPLQPSASAVQQGGSTDHMTPKEKYRQLKSRFKYLVYENECYQEELRNLQRKLLKLSRDKNFLLDRLQPYEMLSNSSDESDSNSVKTVDDQPKVPKKRRLSPQKSKPDSDQAMAEDVKVDSTENESPEQKAMDFTEESKDLNVSADQNSTTDSAESLSHASNGDDVKNEG